MKFLLNMLIIAVISYFAQLYFSYWIVVVIAFLVGLVNGDKAFPAFMAGFIGVGLLWFCVAAYTHQATDGLLTYKIGGIFKGASPFVLMAVSGVIGALLGSLGAITGVYFKQMTQGRARRR